MTTLTSLTNSPADPVFQLTAEFRADPREQKVDLGVGVFRDRSGNTPVMRVVRQAQQRLVAEEQSKSYIGLSGFAPFNAACLDVIFGQGARDDRYVALQTPGGAGAVRLIFELVKLASKDSTLWISEQTWSPHFTIAEAVGLKWKTYPYYDYSTGKPGFEAMLASLRAAKPHDVILLHGCCHNPTGADLSTDQWKEIGKVLAAGGLLPVIDIAYQGFGSGIEEDAAGIRTLVAEVPELLVAYSCSKNFGVYRDRVGCAMAIANTSKSAKNVAENLVLLARGNYSMPPHHGAAIVATVLSDPGFRTLWERELGEMRAQVAATRKSFVAAFGSRASEFRLNSIVDQKGMFSLLPVDADVVSNLKKEFGIYMPGNGRINFAGLVDRDVPRVVDALAKLMSAPAQNRAGAGHRA